MLSFQGSRTIGLILSSLIMLPYAVHKHSQYISCYKWKYSGVCYNKWSYNEQFLSI